jgi:hypothetical protein
VIPLSTGQEQEAGDCTEAEKDPSATSSKTDTDPASSDVPPSSIKSDLISASQALSTHLEQLDNSTQGDNAAVDPLLSSQPVSPIAASHVHVASPLGTAEPTDRSLIPGNFCFVMNVLCTYGTYRSERNGNGESAITDIFWSVVTSKFLLSTHNP